jgi:hypothetical protein
VPPSGTAATPGPTPRRAAALAHHENPYRLRLALGADGNELLVRDRMRSLALVDRTTFEVAAP